MKQVWSPRIGEPETPEVREVACPVAGPGQISVRVRAATHHYIQDT